MNEKGLSKGEFTSVANANDGIENSSRKYNCSAVLPVHRGTAFFMFKLWRNSIKRRLMRCVRNTYMRIYIVSFVLLIERTL